MRLDAKVKHKVSAMLTLHILRKYGTQAQAAAAWGVSQSMVSSVLAGRKNATAAMLKDAGIKLEVTVRWNP